MDAEKPYHFVFSPDTNGAVPDAAGLVRLLMMWTPVARGMTAVSAKEFRLVNVTRHL